jgi:hypothetical protein
MWDLSSLPTNDSFPKPVPLPTNRIPTFKPSSVLNEEKSGGPCRALAFSPKYMVFASGGDTVVSREVS